MEESKGKRKRRTKASITDSIHQAAEQEITQNGFMSSLVTGIIRKARIEPQVFYNRYSDISEFYDDFVKKYDHWITEILNHIKAPIDSEEGMKQLLGNLSDAIKENPLMLELIRWELVEKNQTTLRTAALREEIMQPTVNKFKEIFSNSDIDIITILGLLTGGLYFVSMHQKLAPFYGIDTSTEEGRRKVTDSICQLIHLVYCAKKQTINE